jgi:hypothetical protein
MASPDRWFFCVLSRSGIYYIGIKRRFRLRHFYYWLSFDISSFLA